jgi:hypothetical protein
VAVLLYPPGGPVRAWAGVALSLALLAGWMLGLPVALLLLRDARRDLQCLAQDLHEARVLVFGNGASELGLLPASRWVVSEGAHEPTRFRRAIYGTAAPPSGEDFRTERLLTAEERTELEVHANRVVRLPWWLIVWTALGVVGAIGYLLGSAAPRPAPFPIGLLVLVALWWRVIRQWILRKRILQDVASGRARGLRVGPGSDRVEFLGHSALEWTLNGAPSRWRYETGGRS